MDIARCRMKPKVATVQKNSATMLISASIELSGAQIKNAVLAAIFIARRRRQPVGVEQLIRGIDRELGKEGREEFVPRLLPREALPQVAHAARHFLLVVGQNPATGPLPGP